MAREQQIITRRRTILLHPQQQQRLRRAQAEIIEQNQPDDLRFRMDNNPCPGAQLITELARHAFHAVAKLRIYIVMTVQYSRNGADRDIRALGDVSHRRRRRAPRHYRTGPAVACSAISEIGIDRRSRIDRYPASIIAIVFRLSSPLECGWDPVATAFMRSPIGPWNASGNHTSLQRGVSQTFGWAVVVNVRVLGA